MDDIGVLLDFDSRYGYDENSTHRHHHQNNSTAPRYNTSNPIAGGPMSATSTVSHLKTLHLPRPLPTSPTCSAGGASEAEFHHRAAM